MARQINFLTIFVLALPNPMCQAANHCCLLKTDSVRERLVVSIWNVQLIEWEYILGQLIHSCGNHPSTCDLVAAPHFLTGGLFSWTMVVQRCTDFGLCTSTSNTFTYQRSSIYSSTDWGEICGCIQGQPNYSLAPTIACCNGTNCKLWKSRTSVSPIIAFGRYFDGIHDRKLGTKTLAGKDDCTNRKWGENPKRNAKRN